MIYLGYNLSEDVSTTIVRKLAPPLVTLISSEPEIQYVALRNINLILQRRPDVLQEEMRVFFTKYNDPPYVKLEKLEVIIKLCTESNVDQVLSELKEYANEVDVDFVRKSVRAIGRCAIKITSASDKCVQVLLELIKTGVNYILQEAIVVMKDIFRKYPLKYERIIPALCQNLETLDEPDAKASLIWIIGEYADRIENASELLDHFLEAFKDETSKVQLQLITATVKLFLKRPGSAQAMVQRILQYATQENDNPDIRDRAYIYWRLLSSNPQATKAVVLAEKPPIESDNSTISEVLLDELIYHISSLASVYHKSPSLLSTSSFVDMTQYRQEFGEGEDDGEARLNAVQEAAQAMGSKGDIIGNLLDLDFGTPVVQPAAVSSGAPPVRQAIDDLLSMDIGGPVLPQSTVLNTSPTYGLGGIIYGGVQGQQPTGFSFPKSVLLDSAQSQGLELSGTFVQRNGTIALDLTVSNKSSAPMSDFAIQFNVNTFGIAPIAPLIVPSPVAAGASVDVTLPLGTSGGVQKMEPINNLQIAVKNNVGVFYLQALVPVHVLFGLDPSDATNTAFNGVWSDASVTTHSFSISGITVSDIQGKLKRNGFTVVNQPNPSVINSYCIICICCNVLIETRG